MVDRYVSKAAGSSDSNPGTQASPYVTIGKAATVVNAGDIVHVAPGTYDERVSITRSGTSGSHIRFVSDTKYGAKVRTSGSGGTGWGESAGFTIDAQWIEIDGFEIAPQGSGQISCGIYFLAPNNFAYRNKIYNVAKTVEGPGGITAEAGCDNTTVDSNYIYNIGFNEFHHGIYIADGSARVVNNIVGNCSGFGIHLWHSPAFVDIFNNVSVGNGLGGITVGAGDAVGVNATGCRIANNITQGNGSTAGGIQEAGIVSNNIFVNNTCPDGIFLINGTQSGTSSATPLFVDYLASGLGDYHLQSGSPCRDTGSALYAPALDFDGNARDGTPDRGAYTYGGGPAPAYDLIVTDISWSPATPALGNAVTFSATIQNIGNLATPGATIHGISFLVDGVAQTYSDNNTTSLAAGASRTQAANAGISGATWTATAGSHTITAWVDDANRFPDEIDENNNQLSEQLVIAGAPSAISFVGAGVATHGNYDVAASPPLPANTVAGDLLICFTHLRSNGSATSTWPTIVSNDGSITYLLVSYKIATGSDTAPTITPVATAANQHHTSCVLAFRGVDTTSPFGSIGTAAQFASAEDIGPIAAAVPTHANGAVLVFGARNDVSAVSNAAILSGDGLSWFEAVDAGSADVFSHIVVDYATWTGAAPTLTAKTFDIPGGTAAAISAGVMLTLKPAVTQLAYVGVGTPSAGDYITALSPGLPAGVAAGDLLMAFGYLRNTGTLSISAGWTQHLLIDQDINGSSFYLQVWYRFATASNSPPSITITGGSSAAPSITLAFVSAFRGVDQGQPFGTHGATSFNAGAINVGPIAAPATASLPATGAVLALCARNSGAWTSTAALSGDGLTWIEEFDNYTQTVTGGYGISLAMNHAMWSGTAPTITAKTYIPSGGDNGGPGMGKMFVLNAATTTPVLTKTAQVLAGAVVAGPISISVSADCVVSGGAGIILGALATADHVTPMVPALPAGVAAGDILIAYGYLRGSGTLSISSGWTQHSIADLPQEIYLQTWSTIYSGSTTAPTITTTGGSTSPQTLSMSFIIAARGYNQSNPFGTDGADSVNVTQATIGPIAVPPSLPSSGAVIVTGWRNGTPWTSVPTLTGDGLTWIELVDNYIHAVAGRNIAGVIDYATWFGGAPALTAKTFAPVGGASAPALGKMFVLNAIPSVTNSLTTSANAAVAATPTINVFADGVVELGAQAIFVNADASVIITGTGTASVSASAAVRVSRTTSVFADASVGSLTRNISLSANASVISAATQTATVSADASVVLGKRTISQIVFCDTVVTPAPTQEGLLSPVGELSSERTDTAWLVLLTLSHPDLPSQIRVTSDGVSTVSGGNVFSPFPFEVILPDDVEGRAPQAQLSIDNTTQEIIAALRGLTSPPKLTVQIVRSTNTDVVEYQWIGLEWSNSSYDKNVITGTLTFQDITREEFPYETFDGRWQGLSAG